MEREGLRRARVLLVEDARDIREVFTLLLEAEGASVMATGTGREAVELAAREDFDVLLTDLGLPDIPGDLEIFTLLLEAEGASVMATGTGREAVELAAREDFDVLLTDLGLPDIPGDM